jgi:hypothetical protein
VMTLQAATATSAPSGTERSAKPVAHTKAGTLTSKVVGSTSDGRRVTGSFVPVKFSKHDGKVYVRGLAQGIVHEENGGTTTFSKLKTVRVKSINGQPARTEGVSAPRAICDILHLVLGPLNLDLLGLRVHLNRVVLDIVAATGAGNLLGNLLCAVTGLLDGGPGGGVLGRLTNILNRILGALRMA